MFSTLEQPALKRFDESLFGVHGESFRERVMPAKVRHGSEETTWLT